MFSHHAWFSPHLSRNTSLGHFRSHQLNSHNRRANVLRNTSSLSQKNNTHTSNVSGKTVLSATSWKALISNRLARMCKEQSPYMDCYKTVKTGRNDMPPSFKPLVGKDVSLAFDLLAGLLHVLPTSRLSASEALNHPFFSET